MFQLNVYLNSGDHMEKIVRSIENMNSPIEAEGKIKLNPYGRYELKGREYTSGSGIEFLREYDDGDRCWIASRVEHGANGYYIVGYPDVKMSGLRVRMRQRTG